MAAAQVTAQWTGERCWRAASCERDRVTPSTLAAARSRLIAALGFALLDGRAPELRLVRSWLSTWRGIGLITEGMARQDYDLQLTRYDARGWRATFYVAGMEHSATNATASAWQQTPWQAVHWAAWEALARRQESTPDERQP